MQIELIQLKKLIPYARNARTHSDAQVAQIAGSIREFGFTNPVLIDAAEGIIAGHGRVLAARSLGLSEVPCIRLSHLTDTQRRAYMLADNRIALNSGWDEAMLALELAELRIDDFDLSLLGFSVPEIDKLLSDNIEESTVREVDVDAFQMACQCPRCGFEFDPKQPAASDDDAAASDNEEGADE